MELLNELIDEMDLSENATVERATEHIHAHEVILTCGLSTTTLHFLLKAAERRSFQVRCTPPHPYVQRWDQFWSCASSKVLTLLTSGLPSVSSARVLQVVVAEGAPHLDGLTMGQRLTDACHPRRLSPLTQQQAPAAGGCRRGTSTASPWASASPTRVPVLQVVVAEGAPHLDGLTMGQRLTDAGIPTLVIPDAATFALMARVNKVLVGAQAVLATGGVICQSGARLVALAARHHRVPFVVVTGAQPFSRLCSWHQRRGTTACRLLLSPVRSSLPSFPEATTTACPLLLSPVAPPHELTNPVEMPCLCCNTHITPPHDVQGSTS